MVPGGYAIEVDGHPLFTLIESGHGRAEHRALHALPTDGVKMDLPFARSVVVRSERTIKKTGVTTQETRYYVSSLEPGQWRDLVRGHSAGVENRNHWRRDALFGEDRSRSRNLRLLANLSLIRGGLLRLLPRCFPCESIPVIRERLQSKPDLAITAFFT